MSGIVVLEDVIVPECVLAAAGASGKQRRKNDRTVNQGGYATVNVVNDRTLREYLVGVVAMEPALWAEIEGLYEVTDAGAYGMLLKDPKDSSVTQANGAMQGYMAGVEFGTPGFGNGTPLYGLRQLKKAASSTRTKAIVRTRPNGTPSLYRGGTPVTLGASPGNASLSAAPVYVTFVADSSQNVNSVSVGATTQVTLAAALSGLVVGGRLWLQDLTGADASLLNNLSHEITNIAGAVYTLATNTAGKTITAAGTGKKYPQPDEALTWAGSFYVPVQFADDDMNWDLVKPGEDDDRLISGNSILLIEIREA
ncbi:hypothetical protein [Variovorax sp. JS1663]|uniref:hypothetical protein n=1 Tax=Variovorax sp. JS1663 TaxID=1851577 RepID=UPI000B3468E3|nr:hypothetical protein [Variovorax sp. JS1663]OUL98541.1 hypothetical protein A8M77_30945 [Variovorax sp. JS1663]